MSRDWLGARRWCFCMEAVSAGNDSQISEIIFYYTQEQNVTLVNSVVNALLNNKKGDHYWNTSEDDMSVRLGLTWN